MSQPIPPSRRIGSFDNGRSDYGDHVWVEYDGRVGASIDLTTGDFRAQQDEQLSWATHGTGTTLDSGSTSSLIGLLGPW